MIRRDPIYLSSEVWRWLKILAKSEGIPEEGRIVTADEIADQILRQAIREQHPKLSEHQKRIDQMEAELVIDLRKEGSAQRLAKKLSEVSQ